jgi:hypothetical protein
VKRSSAAEVGKKPEEERKSGAEEKASDDGEIESGVFAAVDDVAGEPVEAKGESSAKIEVGTDEDEENAENKEDAAEFAERVHGYEFSRNCRPSS